MSKEDDSKPCQSRVCQNCKQHVAKPSYCKELLENVNRKHVCGGFLWKKGMRDMRGKR